MKARFVILMVALLASGAPAVFAQTVAFLYPIGRILGRIGLSPFWSVLAVVPLVNLIGLWVLAFADWPARRGAVGSQ